MIIGCCDLLKWEADSFEYVSYSMIKGKINIQQINKPNFENTLCFQNRLFPIYSEISMNYWIQKAYFNSIEGQVDSAKEAIQLFKKIDWGKELKYQEQLEKNQVENCDPGFGLVKSEGMVLHLCLAGNKSYFHYHFREKKKILGIFSSTSDKLISIMEIPQEELLTAIQKYFDNNHDWFMNQKKQYNKSLQ